VTLRRAKTWCRIAVLRCNGYARIARLFRLAYNARNVGDGVPPFNRPWGLMTPTRVAIERTGGVINSTPDVSANRISGGLPLDYDLLATMLGGEIIRGDSLSAEPSVIAEQEFVARRDQDKDDGPQPRLSFVAAVTRFATTFMHREPPRPLVEAA
jgi:hypothetical protein